MIQSVLCWDIDGTLLTTARAGVSAWEASVLAVTGCTVSLADYLTAGLTDVEIATRLAVGVGHDSDITIQELIKAYEDRLPAALPSKKGRVMPGITDILSALNNKPHVASMLLTGNTKRGASAKLTHYGLSDFFDHGAFSDGFKDRVSIAKDAFKQIEQTWGATNKAIYVIGDTPHDIHCGHAIEAKTVAVCTGEYKREALSAHQPWMIFESLIDTTLFFEKLGL